MSFSIMTGTGNSACWTAILSTISNLFPDDVGRNMAFLGAALGIGFILGPMFAAGFYNIGGFPFPFFALCAVQLPLAFAMAHVVPKLDLNPNTLDELNDTSKLLPDEKRDLKLCDVFMVR